MKILDISEVLGTSILYHDHLGLVRSGRICFVEPYAPLKDSKSTADIEGLCWVYIVDDDSELNIECLALPEGPIYYCTLRLSTEIYIDDEDKGISE